MTKVLTVQSGSSEELRLEGGEVIEAQAVDIGATSGQFVWDGQATTHDNIFKTWEELAPALAAFYGHGQAFVTCSDSSILHMTAGQWENISDVTFIAGDGSTHVEIQCDDDCVLVVPPGGMRLTFSGTIQWDGENTTGSVITGLGSEVVFITLEDGDEMTNDGHVPMVNMTDHAIFVGRGRSGSFQVGTIATTSATAGLEFGLFDSSVLASDALQNSTAGSIIVVYDLSSALNVFQTQPVGPTYQWLPTDLANFTQAAGNTGTGGATVTVQTGNINAVWSKKMRVAAAIAGSVSGAATVTATLLRDATPIGDAMSDVFGGAGHFSFAPTFIDTAPDAASHTYTLSVHASAGTLTVAANGAQIVVDEQP